MHYGGPQNHGVLKEEILRIKELRKQNWAEGEDWFTREHCNWDGQNHSRRAGPHALEVPSHFLTG